MSVRIAGYLLSAIGTSYEMFRILLAIFGAIEVLFPRQVVDFMMDVTTTKETQYEFKSWVYKLARLEGFAFVLIAFWWGKDRDRSS